MSPFPNPTRAMAALRPPVTENRNMNRFMMSDRKELDQRLSSESQDLKSDISDLEKKLHYLETTYSNSREHLERLFRSGGQA